MLQTWFYEGSHIVKDLAIVQQGGILAHVVAEPHVAANCDEALVWMTALCSTEKHYNADIIVSDIKMFKTIMTDSRGQLFKYLGH